MRRATAAILILLAACSSGTNAKPGASVPIVVDVPLAQGGLIARQIQRGAELAADQVNASGGVAVRGRQVRLAVRTVDSRSSPATTLANVRDAISRGAVAVVDEGTGIDAAWQAANSAGLPVGITYLGTTGLVEARKRPNVFRIAPSDRGVSFRLAEYLVPKGFRLAILTDDSAYGAGGWTALAKAFSRNHSSVAVHVVIPSNATDVSPMVLQARQSKATAVLVWARAPLVAAVLRAARSGGWKVPFFSATSGEDPIVRQQLSDHPDWVEGLTFASSRLTSEKGTGAFNRFRAAYERKFGPDLVGVRSSGHDVIQPPDWAMYAYDFVKVVAAAMRRAGVDRPGPSLIAAMNEVAIEGANGDERGFNEVNHEGVVDDDVFFARIHALVFVPVKDDPLSASLPAVNQLR